jgi:5-methylthioribose kinase
VERRWQNDEKMSAVYKVAVGFLEADDRAGVERYAVARGLVAPDRLPIAVTRAGDGNMNVTLRLTPAGGRPFILKQARPWVAKYRDIAAPFERTLVEAAFYGAVRHDRLVSGRMPTLLAVDADSHVLALEDVDGPGDLTAIYAGHELTAAMLGDLLSWLERLAGIAVSSGQRGLFENREMRRLNHEHMFRFPLDPENGLDLDAITPGLKDAARELLADTMYRDAVTALGRRYLADGPTLVHGDFFPGSWLQTEDEGVRVIDPEFCFLGDAEFDIGILAGHVLLAGAGAGRIEQIAGSVAARRLDAARVAGYAGVEIMRRLIGVAQLPLPCGLDRKRALLRRSRRLVLEPAMELM